MQTESQHAAHLHYRVSPDSSARTSHPHNNSVPNNASAGFSPAESQIGPRNEDFRPSLDRPSLTTTPSTRLCYAELQGLPRPRVKPALGSSRRQFLTAMLWTAFSLVMVLTGIGLYLREHHLYSRLLKEGLTTTGVVTDLDIDEDGESTSSYVRYRFQATANGALMEFSERDNVTTGVFDEFKVGDQVEVVYLPSDPTVSGLKDALDPPGLAFPLFLGGLGLFLGLASAVMLSNVMVNLIDLDKLERQGLTTEALVYDKWSEPDSDGDSTHVVAFAFEIPTPRGPRIISRAEINAKAHRGLDIGDRARVKYLTSDPEVSLLVDYR